VKQKKPSITKPEADHMTLSHKDAKASSPKDVPVAGEEDPGAALEDLVEPEFGKQTPLTKPTKLDH
jgi:hypothetical protein